MRGYKSLGIQTVLIQTIEGTKYIGTTVYESLPGSGRTKYLIRYQKLYREVRREANPFIWTYQEGKDS